jgi:hypothetical protein
LGEDGALPIMFQGKGETKLAISSLTLPHLLIKGQIYLLHFLQEGHCGFSLEQSTLKHLKGFIPLRLKGKQANIPVPLSIPYNIKTFNKLALESLFFTFRGLIPF